MTRALRTNRQVPGFSFAPLAPLVVTFALFVTGCPADPSVTEADGRDASGADGTSPDPNEGCGRLTTPCTEGGHCEEPSDCASSICREAVCRSPSPADGLKSGDETDVDCGGTSAPACADGKGCAIAVDCMSSVCTSGICQVPTVTDGVRNGDETGKDCGGPVAPKCPTGEGCQSDVDCNKVRCDLAQKKCKAASNDDGIRNLDETGIDCGGPTAGVARCPTGQGCSLNADCANVLCDTVAATCAPPSPTDGLKNGTETDVDCGGGAPTNAAPCAVGLGCLLGADCATAACNHAQRCAVSRSCVVQYGGTTCGKGEVGQAGAVHEDCCTSLPLPDNSVRIDKYEITAGRMREFITRVGNDVQGWVNANRDITAQIPDAMVQYLPTGLNTPTHSIMRCGPNGAGCATTNQSFGVYDHLGLTVFLSDRPCPNCGQGCWIGSVEGQYGHPTYWWPAATQSLRWGAAARAFDQMTLDTKSLNCVAQLMLAAFCAWDGGRLPTQAELGSVNGAWGPAAYPWGTADPSDTLPGAPDRVAYPWATSSFLQPAETNAGGSRLDIATQYNVTNWNPFDRSPTLPTVRYAWPNIPTAQWGQFDTAYAVAAPGRMYNDFRSIGPGARDGYYDVGGNLMEVTGDIISGADDANHNSWPRVQWVGGSFEGHGVNNRGGYNLSVLTKYGKQGGRCARPM